MFGSNPYSLALVTSNEYIAWGDPTPTAGCFIMISEGL